MSAVYIVDEIELKPGCLQEYRERFQREYLPKARERGMNLLHTWLTPPVELEDGTNQLLFVWSVPDIEAWWQMRAMAMQDPDVSRWWKETEHYATYHERRFLTDLGPRGA